MKVTEDVIIARGRARRVFRADPGYARLVRARAGLTQAEIAELLGSTGPPWRVGNWASAHRRASTSIATARFWTAWPARTLMPLDLDVDALRREELPALLGRLVELEARIRLRLAEAQAPTAQAPSRVLTVDEAVVIAAAPSARWLLHATRGHRCRRDLSRKAPRFDEAEFRRWLASRRGA